MTPQLVWMHLGAGPKTLSVALSCPAPLPAFFFSVRPEQAYPRVHREIQNRTECVKELDKAFQSRDLEDWKKRFEGFSGVWAPVINFKEVHEHPQIEPNGFLPMVKGHDGNEFRLVAPPAYFDEVPTAPAGPAPEIGQHTEEVLLDSGLDWEALSAYRESGALG